MKIAVLASEGAPYAKSGGLGDVMEALPAALARIPGNEVVLILPYYKKIKENPAYETELIAQYTVQLGWRRQYAGLMALKNRQDGVKVFFIDNDYYFGQRPGAIYGDNDDSERYAYFSRACLDGLAHMDYIPDVIQCNDWQTAMVPTYLRAMYRDRFPHTKCMYTIHNIEYQGWAGAHFFDDVLGLPWEYRGRMDMNNSVNMMKGAIESADIVLMKSDLLDVPKAIGLSKAVMKNIKQNLFWAFFYNAIGIPVAAGVLYPHLGILLSPMIAAAAMSCSSVSVVTNALRLRFWTEK